MALYVSNNTMHPTDNAVGFAGLNFSKCVSPKDAGNYGQIIDTGWYPIDPGSGGGHGAKLMFSNVDQSGYTLYGLSIRCRSYYAQANAVGLNVSASAAVANSGCLLGGEFYLQNSGSYTINDSDGLPSCALHVKSWLAAACSQTASALWIDDQSTTKATTQYMVNITMNGDIQPNAVFHIYGGDPGAASFITFEACNQGSGSFLEETATVAGDPTVKIKCVHDTTTFYIQGYNS